MTGTRIRACTWVIGLLALAGATVPAAAQTVGYGCDTCSVAADTIYAFVGDPVIVDMTIDAATVGVRGFSLVGTFDSALLQLLDVEKGALLTGACPSVLYWNNALAIGDSVFVDGAGLGCSVDGPGAIVRLEFVAVAEGVALLDWRSGIMRDALNDDLLPLPPDLSWCLSRAVRILGPIPAERSTWGRIKTSGAP
jgi:hypothetical protein